MNIFYDVYETFDQPVDYQRMVHDTDARYHTDWLVKNFNSLSPETRYYVIRQLDNLED